MTLIRMRAGNFGLQLAGLRLTRFCGAQLSDAFGFSISGEQVIIIHWEGERIFVESDLAE
jgi:hypothetical protein